MSRIASTAAAAALAAGAGMGQQQRPMWPGLSAPMQSAAEMVMFGKVPDPNSFHTRRHAYYHRVDYTTAGSTLFTFFDSFASNSSGVSNFPTSGNLPSDHFFKLESIHIAPETGWTTTTNYATVAAGAELAATATPVTQAEEIRRIFQGGIVTLKVGDKSIVDRVFGLENFPQGGGFGVDVASATTATTTTYNAAMLRNGDTNVNNGWRISPNYPLLPQKAVKLTIEFPTALTVTTAFVLKVMLCGQLVTPANL